MALHIYNTLTRKREKFEPLQPGQVRFYLCGPTVYDYFHIGNARPFIIYDVFRRFLQYSGYDVNFVVNVTDVDDKIIRRAQNENRSANEVADEFTKAYFNDLELLRVRPPDLSPKATEHIDDMIALIANLLDKGIAYVLDGDVYYSVEKFKQYGQLSGKNIEDLYAGARVEVDERKENPLDFALWKAAKENEPAWDSPWGKGRPGWHLECSAMSMKYLGKNFDIHAGGEDLIFPHHENEIAQSCGSGDAKFAKYWLHNGFLNIRGEKMSKSIGNVLTVREILKVYRPEVLRLFFLQKHYRSPINYSKEILEDTHRGWERLQNLYDELTRIEVSPTSDLELNSVTQDETDFKELLDRVSKDFVEAMEDDFNTAQAIGKVFELVKESNRIISEGNITENKKVLLRDAKNFLEEMNSLFSLLEKSTDDLTSNQDELAKVLDLIVDIRDELRKHKLWDLSDKIRDELTTIGYVIEDRSEKSIWKKLKT